MAHKQLTNPLTPEHIIEIRGIYRSLINERTFFQGFPTSPAWIRWRYLDGDASTMATVQFGDAPTISIHQEAFDYPNPVLLRGLIHHEMLHLYHGANEGHGAMFRESERSWIPFHHYRREKKRFYRMVSELAVGMREYSYRCSKCERILHQQTPLSPDSACSNCCKAFNNGKWCESYTLIRVGHATP